MIILFSLLAAGGYIGWLIYEFCHAPVIDDKKKPIKTKSKKSVSKQKKIQTKKKTAKKTIQKTKTQKKKK